MNAKNSLKPSARGVVRRIGLLYGDVSSAFFRELLTGCVEQASLSHVQLIVAQWHGGQGEEDAVEELRKMQVLGLILPPPLCELKELHQAVRKSGTLAVTVASARPPEGLLSVNIDDRTAAYAMTRHILSLGHRRIGFITGNPDQSASALRLAGYRKALDEAGIVHDALLVREGQFTYKSGLDAAEALLSLGRPPTAIFASNDDMAAAAVAVAHRRHLEVPGQLTVCGFDDTERSRSLFPRITTIRQPIADMSRAAMMVLLRRLRAPSVDPDDADEAIVLDFALVHRESDGPPPAWRPDQPVGVQS